MVLTLNLPIGPVHIGFSSVERFILEQRKRHSFLRRRGLAEAGNRNPLAKRFAVAQVGNLLYPPTGSRQSVGFSNPQRIANPRYSRLPVCATGVAAPAASGSFGIIRG